MARAKSEFKQQKNIPIKNKKIKKNKIVKPQKIKSNPKKFVRLANESMQSQVKAAAGNQEKKSLCVKRKQQDVDNGVKKFKNNKDQAIIRVHNSNNNIQKEIKDSSLKLIKSSGLLKQDNLKIQSLAAKKKSVVKMAKVETSEQNTDIKKIDIKSSHCSESIEKIPSAQQVTGCRKGKNEILKQKLENTKQEPTQPNPSKQKTVAGSSKDNFTQLDNAEKILLVQNVRSRRRKKQAMSQIVTQLSTVKHGFPNNKNSSEEVENMKPTQPQPKLKEKSVQKAKNVKEIVVDPISDTYLFGSLKVKQGGIHKKDKLDDCLENLKKQKYLSIVQQPIQQTTNSLKKKSDTSLHANQQQNEQFNCEKIPKENGDMENSKRSKPQNLAQEPIKPEAIEKSQSGLFPKISPVKKVKIGKQDKKTNFEKKSKEKQVNFSEKFKSISQNQMVNNVGQKKTEEDKQNILKEIQDNLEKKSRGSNPESIAQKSIKEKDSDSSQSGLKKKKKHDKCEMISKGSKPENKALKSIKRKKAESSQTGLIEEIVTVKQVQFQKQDHDSCEKKSEDKQVNFSKELKSISQKQMINIAEQKKTEEDKQNILKEIQDNLEKKSRGSNPESIAQKSIKEKDSDSSQSGLKKKKKHDKCEMISKGSKPENKALKSIKRKKAESSQTGLIEEIVTVKQVQFQKQDHDSCEKKSEDKQVNFSKELKSISQKQMINIAEQKKTEEDKQNILKEIQDNLEKKSRGSNPESIAQKSIKEKDSDSSQSGLKKKKKHDKCEMISKGSKPENKALKSIKRKKAEASQTGLIEEIFTVKQVQFQKQDHDSCEKKSEDKRDNFKENLKKAKFENIEQEPIQQSINDQKKNSLTLQDIIQNQNKENHKMLKENRDTYVKISKGSKPENKALKPIKMKAEASLTWFIEEIVPEKQVVFEKQNQDTCGKKSEDKQVNFSEKFKSISQKQVQQMINNVGQKNTEEDKQNILNEIQDNLEKKSRGSKPESIAQKSIKEKDSERSQSGLRKKEKHVNCEKISKGSKRVNKALKPIKRKKAEASLIGLIEEIVPVKQVFFEKQNQDCCEKKSEDKQDSFKENLKEAKFENIEQETIQQSINDQKKNSLTLQDIIQNQKKENHKMLKENRDTYVKISKGSKPGNTNLKPIKKKTAGEASLTGLIEKIVPVKQVQNWDQDNGKNKSKEKYENITQELINKTTNGKQEKVQPSQYDLIGRIVPIKPVAICKEINCETNLKQSKPENTTLYQNCVNNIKPEESFKAQISKSPLNQVYDDQSKQINCSEKILEKSAQKLNEEVNNTQEIRVETSKSGLIGRILPVMHVVIDEEENKRDSCTKNSKRKREPIEMQAVQLENNVKKVKTVESELKKLKMSNLVKPTQLVAPGKVTICQSDTGITNSNYENNISPLHQENSEQNQLHGSMDEMLNERWRKMKAKVEKSENKIRSQFMRCTEYVLINEGMEELTEEPMQTKKADEISQTSLIGKLKSLLKRRLTCHF
ncbi:centlein-like isoform X2 [Drosophila nasuta]|uniref:centlein-like isoform X2 n=1 Tax=Drosophila nasuta TaxID=42062 RepID=UPI00295E8E29|nr:centlein-like isoform X2 [Drosophila nasuta]